MRSQGQTGGKDRLSPQQPPTGLSDKQSIQEVTHESPPHNSHVATLKLQGPPIFPWKMYKHYISKKLKKDNVKGFFLNITATLQPFYIVNCYSHCLYHTLLVEAL